MESKRSFPSFHLLFLSLVLVFCLAQLSVGKPQAKSGSALNAKKADFSDDDEDYFYEETDREIKKTIPIRHGHPAERKAEDAEEDNRDVEVRVMLKNPKEESLRGEKRKIQINKKGGDYKLKEIDRRENEILPPLKLDAEEDNSQDLAVIRKRQKANTAEIKRVVEELAAAILADADKYYDALTAELNVDNSLSAWNAGSLQQVNEIEDDDLDSMFSSPLKDDQMYSLNDGEYDDSLFEYGTRSGSYIC